MLRALFGRASGPGSDTSLQRTSAKGLPIRILTHNIRYATSSLFENEKPWEDRYPLIMSQLAYHTRFFNATEVDGEQNFENTSSSLPPVAFICLQEVLHSQLHAILASLNHVTTGDRHSEDLVDGPRWAHIGVAREDGEMKGEYSPIIYPVQLFKLLHFENTWLSPTPVSTLRCKLVARIIFLRESRNSSSITTQCICTLYAAFPARCLHGVGARLTRRTSYC